MKTIPLIKTLFAMLLLCGCTTKYYTILADPACDPPCWRGITMGMPIEDVMNRLAEMPDVDISSIQRGLAYRDPWEEAVDWKFKDDWGINTIYFDDRLARRFFFNHPDRIRISDLLFIYGEPEYIRPKTSGEHSFPVYITVELFYPQRQGVCAFIEPNINPFSSPDHVRISANMSVENIVYVDPAVPNSQIIGCIGHMSEDDYTKEIQPWKGYGYYEFLDEK